MFPPNQANILRFFLFQYYKNNYLLQNTDNKEIIKLAISKEVDIIDEIFFFDENRIKFVPLIAVAVFITTLVSGFMLTKNVIAKKVIKTTVEAVAEARCDIQKVDIKFLDSTFKLTGLQVANKNEPMKNLFSISSITFDFDMLQLLKSRFVANELSVYGVEINSDRTYSGTLPPKKAKKLKNRKKPRLKKRKKNLHY